jgi:hypothetical protein
VPTQADFTRLDPRFRLPDAVWAAMREVADYGFAVFKLKPRATKRTQKVHPMALTFPRRDERAIYYPTLHVHDGTLARSAHFDHTLYCQPPELLAHVFGWGASTAPLGGFVDAARTGGLVDGGAYAFRLPAVGDLANEDVWLHEPTGLQPADLLPRGRSFLARIAAGRGFAAPLPIEDTAHYRRERAWRETSRRHLGRLCRGLREGLVALEESRGSAFGLGAFSWDLPAYFMNGYQLWKGSSPFDGQPAKGGKRGRLELEVFTDNVEPQSISLGFDAMPDAEGRGALQAELRRILDAAVS